jgi:Tfp pilus assembly protein PilE
MPACDKSQHSQAGATLVELLVVGLILALLGVGLSVAISRALTIDHNFKEETGVRTALANQLAYAERYLSLATSVVVVTHVLTNTFFEFPTNRFEVVTNQGLRASYPRETGGIAWETNHWTGVTAVEVKAWNGELVFEVQSSDTNRPFGVQSFSPFGLPYSASARVTNVTMEGVGAVRRLIIQAAYEYQSTNGLATNSITASRPVRIWNQP